MHTDFIHLFIHCHALAHHACLQLHPSVLPPTMLCLPVYCQSSIAIAAGLPERYCCLWLTRLHQSQH